MTLGVVMYSIQNGTDRKSTEWWSEYSLHERTQAIYNDIRRLDETPPKRIVVPLAKKREKSVHVMRELAGR